MGDCGEFWQGRLVIRVWKTRVHLGIRCAPFVIVSVSSFFMLICVALLPPCLLPSGLAICILTIVAQYFSDCLDTVQGGIVDAEFHAAPPLLTPVYTRA